LPQKDPREGDGTSAGTEGGNRDVHVEHTDQFFQDEDSACERCVKGRRQASARTGRQEDPTFIFVAAEESGDQLAGARTDVNRGSLPSQG
jgi:hypothetical protein